MSLTNDPAGHLEEPTVPAHTVPAAPATDAPTSEPVATSAALATAAPSRPTDTTPKGSGGGKRNASGFIGSATALAAKLRTEVPKKVRDVRDKRAVGRHVIVTENDGRIVAIGPYASSDDARRDAQRVSGSPTVVELVPDRTFFPPSGDTR